MSQTRQGQLTSIIVISIWGLYNKEVNTSYEEALAWGNMYFEGNFTNTEQG